MDAVEFALGQSLPNKTAFGGLKHPETGEANGAYFLLFLQERKLSYFGSEVYDQRNLGEKRWKGNLDGPAIRAMRSGGRFLDAAKDTIINIDHQLIRKLSVAKRDRQRAADRAQRLKVETDSLIQTAQIEIKVADYRAKELAHDLGNPSGDLVRPEIAAWSTGVEKAKQLRASNDSAAAGSTIQGVRPLIGSYLGQP